MPVSSDVALNDIPSGKVAISLTVKTLASGLSDKLQPNDIIRIYHFLDVAADVPELQFLKVLSVTDSDGINVDNTKELAEDEEKQQSATITVLATPEQAKIITALENEDVYKRQIPTLSRTAKIHVFHGLLRRCSTRFLPKSFSVSVKAVHERSEMCIRDRQ